MTGLLPPVVACPELACGACNAEVGCERVTEQAWAWVHASPTAGCPGLVVPAGPVCYLVHLIPAYRHARHYLGTAEDLPARLRRHALGRGSRLLAAALAAGGDFELVRLWPGAWELERVLKRRKASPRLLCPACPTRAQARHLAIQPLVALDPCGGVV